MFWMVGSLNVDLVAHVPRFPVPGESLIGSSFSTFLGGKGGNQAVALSRLGAAPHVVACVGNDQFGERYIEDLRSNGADTKGITIVPDANTGTALIEVDSSGQNRLVYIPGANALLSPDHIDARMQDVSSGDIVLLQLEVSHETVAHTARIAHAAGATVILDPAPAAPLTEEIYRHVDWITPNESEASTLTGIDTSTDDGLADAAADLVRRGVRNVIVKAGSRGAILFRDEMTHPTPVPGYHVDAVDTTAAGDSFNAGFAWALGQNQEPERAIGTANAVAAISVTGFGAQTAMPTRAQLEEFLRQKK
jgi:ribokinase